MTITLYNADNVEVMDDLLFLFNPFNLVYADCMYELEAWPWVQSAYDLLDKDGIFILQTDWHTVAEYKVYLDKLFGKNHLVNWCIYINDWGGTPKKGFPRKHDDILIYSKGNDYYFDKSKIEIPKVTAGTKFDKKGTGMKTPCDVFYDHASFSTMSKERVKMSDGRGFSMQKPVWLLERLILPFTKENDRVISPFLGTGTCAEVCATNNRNYVGIELDKEVFNLACKRLSDKGIEYEDRHSTSA